jgi:hypothetical protein
MKYFKLDKYKSFLTLKFILHMFVILKQDVSEKKIQIHAAIYDKRSELNKKKL